MYYIYTYALRVFILLISKILLKNKREIAYKSKALGVLKQPN